MNRDEQKEATAYKIIASAKALFAEQGYEATNTRQIAKHAGVGVGTVFSHFKDKHQLTKVLFFGELEKQLNLEPAERDQGGLVFFSVQTKQLFDFYNGDRSLAKAFLQNAIFEKDYFSEQLADFISLVSSLLIQELPERSEQQRTIIAQAWMGFYFQQLLSGLSDSDSIVELWHTTLIAQCRQLLVLVTNDNV